MTRLWLAALIAAAIPWIYKLAGDRGNPLFSAHENAVHSKLGALLLLAVYGVTYLAITAAFKIQEATAMINRGRRLLRR